MKLIIIFLGLLVAADLYQTFRPKIKATRLYTDVEKWIRGEGPKPKNCR